MIALSPANHTEDNENTKITSMHLYPRRRNGAAQMAEELKTVTYANPSYAGTQKERKKERNKVVSRVSGYFEKMELKGFTLL